MAAASKRKTSRKTGAARKAGAVGAKAGAKTGSVTAAAPRGKPRKAPPPVLAADDDGGDDGAAPQRSTPLGLEVDAEVLEFIEAIDRFKKEHARPFPSWSEVLHVLRELGYERR